MDAYTERRIIPPLVVRFAWLVTDFVCCSPMHPYCSPMHPYCSGMHPSLVVRCAYCSGMHPSWLNRIIGTKLYKLNRHDNYISLYNGTEIWIGGLGL